MDSLNAVKEFTDLSEDEHEQLVAPVMTEIQLRWPNQAMTMNIARGYVNHAIMQMENPTPVVVLVGSAHMGRFYQSLQPMAAAIGSCIR